MNLPFSETQRIGSLDQGVVRPGEQDKAEEERQAGAPARRRQTMTGLTPQVMATDCHAKSGGRCARDVYPLSLLDALSLNGSPEQLRNPAKLILATGEVFPGYCAGSLAVQSPDNQNIQAERIVTGEIVFNTVMAGYQEVITDPSYAGQVVTFTYPHIGNYGISSQDYESSKPWLRGVVTRSLENRTSSWRSEDTLESWLIQYDIPAITGIDTRRLTMSIREQGAVGCAFGTAPESILLEAARREPGTTGADLTGIVTTNTIYHLGDPNNSYKVVAYDFGIKRTILDHLKQFARVSVVPAGFAADDALSLDPDIVFLSNGPGDPAALDLQASIVSDLVGRVPIFGICLGHQILARAIGAETYKLPFGHHGGNHPVKRLATGKVEVTSQNHNYAVSSNSLKSCGAMVTHVNLNDGVVEGMRVDNARIESVQYHPESSPGPHDSAYLFDSLKKLIQDNGSTRDSQMIKDGESAQKNGLLAQDGGSQGIVN